MGNTSFHLPLYANLAALCRRYGNFGIIFACKIHDSNILLKEARYKATPHQTIINYQKHPL